MSHSKYSLTLFFQLILLQHIVVLETQQYSLQNPPSKYYIRLCRPCFFFFFNLFLVYLKITVSQFLHMAFASFCLSFRWKVVAPCQRCLCSASPVTSRGTLWVTHKSVFQRSEMPLFGGISGWKVIFSERDKTTHHSACCKLSYVCETTSMS